jgi:hypothetical protein
MKLLETLVIGTFLVTIPFGVNRLLEKGQTAAQDMIQRENQTRQEQVVPTLEQVERAMDWCSAVNPDNVVECTEFRLREETL